MFSKKYPGPRTVATHSPAVLPHLLARLSKFGAAVVLGASLAACGGGDGDGDSLLDQAGSAILNFLSDGAFSDLDTLVTSLMGDELVIDDFGQSVLGSNPGILPRGSALVDDVSCASDTCTGQVLVPKVTNGVLQSVSRESGTIRREGDKSFVISSPSTGSRTFTQYIKPPAANPSPTAPAPTVTPPPATGTTTTVINQPNLEGDRKSNKYWFFNVPEGTRQLEVVLSEAQFGSQLADLFVNHGSQATIPDQDRVAYVPANWKATCASVNPNRETEICRIDNPPAGTWYVHVYGYHAYWGANLKATTTR